MEMSAILCRVSGSVIRLLEDGKVKSQVSLNIVRVIWLEVVADWNNLYPSSGRFGSGKKYRVRLILGLLINTSLRESRSKSGHKVPEAFVLKGYVG